jgi:hypothetical protein
MKDQPRPVKQWVPAIFCFCLSCGGADPPCAGGVAFGDGGQAGSSISSSGGGGGGGARSTGGVHATGGKSGVAGKPVNTGGAPSYSDSGASAPDVVRVPIDPVLACMDMGASFCCGTEEADGHIYSVVSCPSCQDGACCTGPGASPYAGACSCLFPLKNGFGCR